MMGMEMVRYLEDDAIFSVLIDRNEPVVDLFRDREVIDGSLAGLGGVDPEANWDILHGPCCEAGFWCLICGG